MKDIKIFTSSEVKRHTGDFINEAFNSGGVEIHHRDRGVLLVMTEERLYELVASGIEGYTQVINGEKPQ